MTTNRRPSAWKTRRNDTAQTVPAGHIQMKWPSWLRFGSRKPAPSPTQCPVCGMEMSQIEKNTISGSDLRTFRCERCGKEHDLDFGIALWKAMSDANKSDD